jgi:hypothetical protein
MSKKTFYTATLLCILFLGVFAQKRQDYGQLKIPHWNAQSYVGGGTGLVSGLGARLYFSNKLIIGGDFNSSYFTAANLPDNYEPGFSVFGDGVPKDNMTSYSVMIGRYIPVGQIMRLSLEAGPGYKTYSEMNFTPRSTTGWLDFGSNYNTYTNSFNTIGIIAEARVEFNVSRYIGIGIGGSIDASQYKTIPALRISLLAGKLRGKKTKELQ